jgi:hypothetical protein
VGALKLQYNSQANLQVVYKATPNGTVVEETNYDPWGRVRDANTWQYPSESVAQSHALAIINFNICLIFY